jgi:uncharacterized protein HemY|tara:strand:- start:343 stop:660 length:318 start_codon:yes stop_codon:yes gene_type:complete
MAITDNLEKMLAQGKDSAMLRFGLGSAYFKQKAYIEAIPHFEACIEQDPEYTAAYKLLGKALVKQKDDVGALAVFQRGLPVAIEKGDKQSEREMSTFVNKLLPQQ